MKWLKGTITANSATLGTTDIPMPVQRGQGRGMNFAVVIHTVELQLDSTLVHAMINGSDKNFAFTIAKTTPTAIQAINDASLVCMFIWNASFLSDVGNVEIIQPFIQKFNPPVMVPNEKLVAALYQGSGGAGTIYFRIGYTIRSVSQDEMYAALNNQ